MYVLIIMFRITIITIIMILLMVKFTQNSDTWGNYPHVCNDNNNNNNNNNKNNNNNNNQNNRHSVNVEVLDSLNDSDSGNGSNCDITTSLTLTTSRDTTTMSYDISTTRPMWRHRNTFGRVPQLLDFRRKFQPEGQITWIFSVRDFSFFEAFLPRAYEFFRDF